MAKTVADRFKDFMNASTSQSSKPMTKREIATVVGKKKRKAATRKRSLKSHAKKKVAKKAKSSVKKVATKKKK